MPGEVFYPPPWPRQPTPHVPIPAQGDQPPRRTVAATMALVLASWPTGLEYQAPQRAPTVPIPRQGDQPPRRTNALLFQNVLASWPTGFEYQPYQRYTTAPIPNQGDQPPKYSGITSDMLVTVQAWDPAPPPQQQARYVAPLVAVPPASVPYVRPPDAIRWSWEPEVRPPPRPVAIAPLTLTYGDQPPRATGALSDLLVILQAWQSAPPQPQQFVPSNAVAGLVPTPYYYRLLAGGMI